MRATVSPGTVGDNNVRNWRPPVLRTSALNDEGIQELLDAIDKHSEYSQSSGALQARRRERLRERVMEIVEQQLRQRLWHNPETQVWLDLQLPAMESGETTPFAIAQELRRRSALLMTAD